MSSPHCAHVSINIHLVCLRTCRLLGFARDEWSRGVWQAAVEEQVVRLRGRPACELCRRAGWSHRNIRLYVPAVRYPARAGVCIGHRVWLRATRVAVHVHVIVCQSVRCSTLTSLRMSAECTQYVACYVSSGTTLLEMRCRVYHHNVLSEHAALLTSTS